jgi:hypothetical protein
MTDTLERADFLERHYTIAELAKAWKMGYNTLKPWFMEEPGVIKYGAAKLKKGRRRTHVSLRVPESVARRVYRKITGKEVQPGREFTPRESESSAPESSGSSGSGIRPPASGNDLR